MSRLKKYNKNTHTIKAPAIVFVNLKSCASCTGELSVCERDIAPPGRIKENPVVVGIIITTDDGSPRLHHIYIYIVIYNIIYFKVRKRENVCTVRKSD